MNANISLFLLAEHSETCPLYLTFCSFCSVQGGVALDQLLE